MIVCNGQTIFKHLEIYQKKNFSTLRKGLKNLFVETCEFFSGEGCPLIRLVDLCCRKYTEESAWIHKTAAQLNGVPMKVSSASDIPTIP